MDRTILLTCQQKQTYGEVRMLRGLLQQGPYAGVDCAHAQTPGELLQTLAGQLDSYNLFVLAAETAQFYALKAQLVDVLGYAVAERPEIYDLQTEKRPEDAAFPAGAQLFLTAKAYYNGFALRCGNQDMLVLPLENGLLAQLRPQLRAYLRRVGTRLHVLQPGEAEQPSEVDMQFMRLGERCMASPEPIDPAAIEPLGYGSLQYQDALADAGERIRQLLAALTNQTASYTLLLPAAWCAAADLIAALGGSPRLKTVVLEQAVPTLEEALWVAGKQLQESGCTFCQAVTDPMPHPSLYGALQSVAVLRGQGDYAQVRQLEHSPAFGGILEERIPELTEALCQMLQDSTRSDGAPPENVKLVAAYHPVVPGVSRHSRQKGRAVAAASLALCSVAASLFLTLYFQGNRANAADAPTTGYYTVDRTGARLGIAEGLSEFIAQPQEEDGLAPVVYAATQDAAADEAASAFFDFIGKLYHWAHSAITTLVDAIHDTWPTALTTAPVTTMSTTTAASTSTSAAAVIPPDTEPTAAATTTTTATPLPPDPVTQSSATTVTTTTTTTTTAPSTRPPASQGTYKFAVVGFGHGVGLSQEGARAYALQGWTYDQIIKHYYNDSGISLKTETPKAFIAHAGVAYELREYLARIAYGEIGGPHQTKDEAIKAQMVCAYTVAKKAGYSTTENNQHLLPAFSWNSSFAQQYKAKLYALADSVLGKYVAYNGGVAETLFFASCNGFTASGKYAWGGNTPPVYLAGGRSSPENAEHSTPSFTTDQIRSLVSAYNAKNPNNAITLGSDASQWLKILNQDAYGYVEYIQIGNRTFTGGMARLYFFGASNLRSHNFTFTFEG